MASILPVFILIYGLCICGIVPGLLIRPRADVIPVNLRSVLSADYSADRRNLSFSAIDLGLVEDYWLDNDVSPAEAAQRLSTLTVLLQTPVPTITPIRGQTSPRPTSTPPSPATVERQAASPTPMPAVIQSASASPTPSPTSTIRPSATAIPSRTSTASASPTPLASPTPTGTASPALLPSRTPSATASATLLPYPTASSAANPTLWPSLTPTTATPQARTLPSHPTPTPSFTPRPPTTPLPTATPLPPTDPPPPPATSVPPPPEPPAAPPPAGELSVTPLCSDNPEVERRWSISHTGAGEVSFTWELLGGQGQSGTGSIGANASMTFSTGAKSGTTVMRVNALGYPPITAVNQGELCSPPQAPPPPPPETPTEVPTATLEPSPTEMPTQTPEPSATDVPTQTPEPTETPG